ncbi:MAG: chloride channel protein [Bdellovibrionia bacterium]
MNQQADLKSASTTDGIPLTEGLAPVLASANIRAHASLVDKRVVLISGVAIGIGLISGFVAQILVALIGFVTNLFFYGRVSWEFSSPANNNLGLWVVGIPIIGGIIVGFMARYGSKAIRGHGIPEAMEQVLLNESKIPARMIFLKPLSAAISIGTGGPFGAEGPIIATGGALGSFFGQILRTTAHERKVLLAAGAAAGMTATFGSPASAVLLAIELLLFEFRPRSLIPVALAAATAAGVRLTLVGSNPVFPMPDITNVQGSSIAFYILMGALIGVASVYVTRLVYWIEDMFEHLPMHWMWWPAIGGIAVGVVGYFHPLTLGVGYTNIEHILSGELTGKVMLVFCVMKLISWSISLGSGTSGGTLAPLFTIGGGLGAALGLVGAALLPHQGIDPRVAALVGMAAIFAGSSRAMLASVIFAFECTRQPLGLLPLLGGCTASYLVSCLMMRNTIMTEKIVRRGVVVPSEYSADFLEQVTVKSHCTKNVVSLAASMTVSELRELIEKDPARFSHQGFPIMKRSGGNETELLGVITRRDFLNPSIDGERQLSELIQRAPVVVNENDTLRHAANLMSVTGVGRLPVMQGGKLIGMLTRSDILSSHQRRLREASASERSFKMKSKSV